MTTTRQNIEALDIAKWAALTRCAARESVESSKRLGLQPRPEAVVLAAMTESELVEHRERNGPAKTRRSPVMQLVEADQRSREAQSKAREADQGRMDAEAAAEMARAEADESAREAEAARERVRVVEAESAEKDRLRVQERADDQQAVQLAHAETERIRAEAAAEVAAALERARAAEARAQQRMAERTSERTNAETLVQQLQTQLEQVRADAAAEVAAAVERVHAAEARAEQRMAERSAERAAGEEAVARVRDESEQVRADAAAEVAAARGQASGEVAAARRAAQAEIDSAKAYTEDVLRQAHDEVARAMSTAAEASRFLAIPIAPVEVRPHIRPIEDLLDALYQIGYVLESRMAEIQRETPPDVEFVRNLTWSVQERTKGLSYEVANLQARFTDQSQAEASAAYVDAAGGVYSALLQRIEGAVQRLVGRNRSQDTEIVETVSTMLADPRIQALRQPLS